MLISPQRGTFSFIGQVFQSNPTGTLTGEALAVYRATAERIARKAL